MVGMAEGIEGDYTTPSTWENLFPAIPLQVDGELPDLFEGLNAGGELRSYNDGEKYCSLLMPVLRVDTLC